MKYILLTLMLIVSPVYAQETAKDRIFTIDDFSGGLDSKLSPFQIPANQADIAQNVRYDTQLKALTKRDKTLVYGTASATSPILGMHRLYLSDNTKVLLVNYANKIAKGNDSTGVFTDILSQAQSDRKAQWLTWHNMAIGTDGYNPVVKYDGTSTAATYIGSLLAKDSGGGAGPNGTYTYKVTCVTAAGEYSLDTASSSVTVVDNAISLSMIPVCPDTIIGAAVTGKKIYRPATGSSTYKVLSNGSIANAIVVLTDSDADGALGATLNPTLLFTPPKGKLVLIHKNRLWILNNPDYPSRAYYSEDGSHDIFLPSSYFDIRQNDGDEITCANNVLGKLTICKNNTIQKIYTEGDIPAEDWEISDPFSFVGCHAIYSAANTPFGLIYLSNNGIYSFNGQYSELLSDAVTPEIKDIAPSNIANTWGVYYKNAYYLTYTSLASGETFDNRVLVLDLLTKAFAIDLLNINVFHVLRSGSDVEVLYSGGSASGKIYAHGENTREIVHRRASDFSSGTFTNMRVIPEEVGGDPEDPILEIARTATIDSVVGTIDSIVGTIDRGSLTGNFISTGLTVNASRFDKLYWNETLPTAGSNVTFAVRSAATIGGLAAAAFSSEYGDASGSDISPETANTVIQYRISMTTDDYAYTPTIYKANNYNIRLTYNISGGTDETTVPLRWRTGWMDLGLPGYKKTLKKLYVYYDSASTGTLNVDFENYGGNTDTFAIDLQQYPNEYVEYFENGAFLGELFRLNITESSLNALKIKKIIIVYSVEPLI